LGPPTRGVPWGVAHSADTRESARERALSALAGLWDSRDIAYFEKAIEIFGRILIELRNILGPETFRVRAARRVTCSFGWTGFA
jgi:hypothetical protein